MLGVVFGLLLGSHASAAFPPSCGAASLAQSCPDMAVVNASQCPLFYVEAADADGSAPPFRLCEMDAYDMECVPAERACLPPATDACESMFADVLARQKIGYCGRCRVTSTRHGPSAQGCAKNADCADACGCAPLYGLARGECRPFATTLCSKAVCQRVRLPAMCFCR